MSSIARPRVLCVDDDEDSCEMLTTLLGLVSVEAKAVRSGAQALSLIQQERFQLYLLDAWLPDLDGFELCRQVRSFNTRTPILFFSGAAYEADRRRGIEAGANDYVIKPNIEDLLGSVARFVAPELRPTAKIIPFRPRVNHGSPFSFDLISA